MIAQQTSIPGALILRATPDPDPRGSSTQLLDTGAFEAASGRPMFRIEQLFHGRSRAGVLRGLHFTTGAGGSEKIVFCMGGEALDVLVDLRPGSPAFGRYETVRLVGDGATGVYFPPGVGHAYMALADDTVICYLLSNPYVPEREVAIDPLDPDLALPWPSPPAVMSERDTHGLGFRDETARRLFLPYAEKGARA
ncbi:dTDP-4-dehydrorhamnose 3,5-epimerase family protein [Myceligenerans xiligouense]|uniref:dTDP-4-dehydrorhamnose 3,5-epimerase n=1 Tax=Myceligenerans xiligouense TaxID=253184 RepID=A0A3N4ZGM4_9MICO|nr:dTDP-4-dehydrorhamnose 3,5-epimerase family protein [Myceligenerans xiligouense]RPF20005.1 dTDP-4-dehydrorhamnose 3,5-epimerase [Myceligenerans xiligouense]